VVASAPQVRLPHAGRRYLPRQLDGFCHPLRLECTGRNAVDILGFNRLDNSNADTFEAGSDTYYIRNTDTAACFTAFPPRNLLEQTGRPAGESGGDLDIDPLNDTADTAYTYNLAIGSHVGALLLKGLANSTDRVLNMTSNSFSIHKEYHDGQSCIRSFTMTMRRRNGSIFQLGNAECFLTLQLTVKRT